MRYEILCSINGEQQYLDTFKDETVSLNFNIADINDITKKNSSYSKTVTLPDTKNNRDVFKYISSLTSMSTFDATKKSRCWILKDTVVQMEGYLQLQNIIFDDERNMDTYKCVIYGDQDTLITNIGEKYITELSLERFDHTYDSGDIIASWGRDYTNGYYYPLIDYGFPLDGLVFEAGIALRYFYPAYYVKVIFDQIFIEAGYSYTSDFLNSEIFKKLIIPFNNKAVSFPIFSTTDSNNTIFQAGLSPGTASVQAYRMLTATATTPSLGSIDLSSFNLNTDIFDPNGYYNSSTFAYSNPVTTRYPMRFKIDLDMSVILAPGAGYSPYQDPDTAQNDLYIVVKRSKNPMTGVDDPSFGLTPSSWEKIVNDYTDSVPGWASIPIGGSSKLSIRNVAELNESVVVTESFSSPGTFNIRGTIYTDYLIDYPLFAGEQVRFYFVNYLFDADYLTTPTTFINSQTLISADVDTTTLARGSDVITSNLLSTNVKQKDFLFDIIKMFNLYIEVSKSDANNFIIEPRDDYYNKYQVIKDWSQKLDLNETIDSEVVSNTQKGTNLFTYKADKDMYNTNYTNDTNQIFGQYKNEINNEFIRGDNKIELMFSPTPLDKAKFTDNMYISNIYSYTDGIYSRNGMNIRILYANPIGVTQSIYVNDEFNVIGRDTMYPQTIYPYAGYVDDPTNPTFSLNFGQVSAFYPGYNETVNNLYYTYWQNTLEELSDPDGRIVEASFNLTSNDISQFRFSDLILLKVRGSDGYYRVNKIMNYDPSTNKTTRVQLLKARDYVINRQPQYIPPPLTPIGNPTGVYSRLAPVIGQINLDTSTITEYIGVINTGRDNFINNFDVLNVGHNNSVSAARSGSFGYLLTNNGEQNILVGSHSLINGSNNLSVGASNSSTGNSLITLGNNINVLNNGLTPSFFFGSNIGTSQSISGSFVIGNDISPTQSNATIIGTENLIVTSSFVEFTSVTFSGVTFSFYQEVTYSELVALSATSSLKVATHYKVKDRGDRGLYLTSLTTSTLNKVGTRLMLCPAFYGVGSSGGNNWKGVWYAAISGLSVNDLVIWGGLVWKSLTGAAGTAPSDLGLDGINWSLISKSSFSNGEYVEMQFGVSYDITNDWIEKQWDQNQNVIGCDFYTKAHFGLTYSGCDVTDWNMVSSFSPGYFFGNKAPLGIFNNTGAFIQGNTIMDGGIKNNTTPSINFNICAYIDNNLNTASILSNNIPGFISLNTANITDIYNNINVGNITNNDNVGFIGENSNNGSISSNTSAVESIKLNKNSGGILQNSNNGDISFNSCTGRIQLNSNASLISFNSNNGNITNNSNNGTIDSNSNNGTIDSNSNTDDIFYNSNNGNITSNSNNGYINLNSNGGRIDSNSNNGYILNNSNGGYIVSNTNPSYIQYNSNGGIIFNNSNIGYISYNSNGDDIYINSNSGNISYNSNTYMIYLNSNDGSISINGNNGYINENSNNGSIIGNINQGNIGNNDLWVSTIFGNLNNGFIHSNTGGSSVYGINNNTNNGDISGSHTADVDDPVVNK